ncbi:DUF350 domain-containing protein [Photorhabdus temperata]|uniref:Membrane protein n=2 Tax=Photorhabdus temperata TaxID=574560 RepID=U7QWW7_PHOTE|nr:DUF350 domain-containing protein [Photorhabdus temperata]ERT11460.1 membrane protein [Photorhabdus temperata J3]KER04639.1 putative membrane protein [Photorhabdus temperata subsp. temperata Meg1]MCT8346509.1 DUF350 domain-containing protein [Photorhabdus temperata]
MITLADEEQALTQFIDSVTNFGLCFGLALVFFIVFKFIYVMVTPQDEWKLIKEEKNTAAAVSLGGALVGYTIAIASAASNSIGVIDFVMWGVVALLAQIAGFFMVRVFMMPKIVSRIENNEIPAAVVLAAVSISVGLLNAACMTY